MALLYGARGKNLPHDFTPRSRTNGVVHAFVMIETGAGAAGSAVETALSRAAVVEAHVVAGEYDVIAEVEGETVETIVGAAADLRSIEGVLDSRTYVAME
jgi:DNA-binding Lrp family transcriptional regulator